MTAERAAYLLGMTVGGFYNRFRDLKPLAHVSITDGDYNMRDVFRIYEGHAPEEYYKYVPELGMYILRDNIYDPDDWYGIPWGEPAFSYDGDCPNCGGRLMFDDNGDEYCIDCGQSIKRSALEWDEIPDDYKDGDCFEEAWGNQTDDDNLLIAHGIIRGIGPLSGYEFVHAWNEWYDDEWDTIMCMDTANGKNLVMPYWEYYQAIGVINGTVRRYDADEAYSKAQRYMTYGPWEDDMLFNIRKVAGSGDCFVVALENVMADRDLYVCHGIVHGQGPLIGLVYPHAWNETRDGYVIDQSNGNDVFMSKEQYYAIGKIDPSDVRRYTFEQAGREVLRTEVYGPWDSALDFEYREANRMKIAGMIDWKPLSGGYGMYEYDDGVHLYYMQEPDSSWGDTTYLLDVFDSYYTEHQIGDTMEFDTQDELERFIEDGRFASKKEAGYPDKCPFCGNTHLETWNDSQMGWCISCDFCYAMMTGGSNEDAIIDRWNHRVASRKVAWDEYGEGLIDEFEDFCDENNPRFMEHYDQGYGRSTLVMFLKWLRDTGRFTASQKTAVAPQHAYIMDWIDDLELSDFTTTPTRGEDSYELHRDGVDLYIECINYGLWSPKLGWPNFTGLGLIKSNEIFDDPYDALDELIYMVYDANHKYGSVKKTAAGFDYTVVTEIDPSWSGYDKSVAQGQLDTYGEIYVDSFGQPIDNEYDLMEIEDERGVFASIKSAYREIPVNDAIDQSFDYLYGQSAFAWEGMSVDKANLDAIFDAFVEIGAEPNDDLRFYEISGRAMNERYKLTGDNAYPDDLNILCIPLEDFGDSMPLVMWRFNVGGRWFDDVVDNNAMRERGASKKTASKYELARKMFVSLIKMDYPSIEYAVQSDGDTIETINAGTDAEAIEIFLKTYPNAVVYDEPKDISDKWASRR